jgi:hypothetical protein
MESLHEALDCLWVKDIKLAAGAHLLQHEFFEMKVDSRCTFETGQKLVSL